MEGLVCGSYRLTRKLGEGGMAEVWAARHSQLSREAAIKILQLHMLEQPEAVRRFLSEAEAASAIEHPGIVKIYDVGYASDGRAFIAMELLLGEGLGDRLQRLGTLSLRESYRFMRQLAGAMQSVHAHGIFHRDLKPENLFIVPDIEIEGGERIKVLDFGLAKLASEYSDSESTSHGAVFGTPAYMAPEQCRDAGTVDERADLYSIGCIFYRCICGCSPFEHTDPVELMLAQINAFPRRASELRPDLHPMLDNIIMQLLAKSPDDRPHSCGEFVNLLAAVPAPALEEGQTYPKTVTDLAARSLAMAHSNRIGNAATAPTARTRAAGEQVRDPSDGVPMSDVRTQEDSTSRFRKEPRDRPSEDKTSPLRPEGRRRPATIQPVRGLGEPAGVRAGTSADEPSQAQSNARYAKNPAAASVIAPHVPLPTPSAPSWVIPAGIVNVIPDGSGQFRLPLPNQETARNRSELPPRRLVLLVLACVLLAILVALIGLGLILRSLDDSSGDSDIARTGPLAGTQLTSHEVASLMSEGYGALRAGVPRVAAKNCRLVLQGWDHKHVEANVLCAKSACALGQQGREQVAHFMKYVPDHRRIDVSSYCRHVVDSSPSSNDLNNQLK